MRRHGLFQAGGREQVWLQEHSHPRTDEAAEAAQGGEQSHYRVADGVEVVGVTFDDIESVRKLFDTLRKLTTPKGWIR